MAEELRKVTGETEIQVSMIQLPSIGGAMRLRGHFCQGACFLGRLFVRVYRCEELRVSKDAAFSR